MDRREGRLVITGANGVSPLMPIVVARGARKLAFFTCLQVAPRIDSEWETCGYLCIFNCVLYMYICNMYTYVHMLCVL